MKKIYQKPAITTDELQAESMIAASSVEGFNGTLDDNGADGGVALSRRGQRTVWEDVNTDEE